MGACQSREQNIFLLLGLVPEKLIVHPSFPLAEASLNEGARGR